MVIGIANNYKEGKDKIRKYFEERGYTYVNDASNIKDNTVIDIEDLLDRKDILDRCNYVININENSTLNTFSHPRYDLCQIIHNPEVKKYHLEINLNENWEDVLDERIEFLRNDVLVSIVVPVYNVERYLKRCVDSILRQSYPNIEVILVDDGTKDASDKICDMYAKMDARVKVIHKKNAGLSMARNTGMENACGKYILFIDSDDYVENNMVELMLKKIIKEDADICECGFFVHNKNGIINDVSAKLKIFGKNNCRLDLMNYYADGNIVISTWNKMYKLEKIRNIKFDPNVFKEDTDYTFKMCDNGFTFTQIDTPLYHYIKKEDNSLTGRVFNERFFNLASWAEENTSKIRSYGKEYTDAADKILFNCYVHILKYYLRDYKKNKIKGLYLNEIKDILNKLIKLTVNTVNVQKYRYFNNVIDLINYYISEHIIDASELYTYKLPVIGIIWNSMSNEYKEEVINYLKDNANVISVKNIDYKDKYQEFIKDIYVNNKELEGVSYLKYVSLIDRYKTNEISIVYMEMDVSLYEYTNNVKGYQFIKPANIKRYIRNTYKDKIYGYVFDNVFHMTMNIDEYDLTKKVIDMYE